MMNDRISDKLKVLKPSGIRKFFDIVATKKDVISLGVGEPDFATPWNIVDAAFYNMNSQYFSSLHFPIPVFLFYVETPS